MVIVDTSHTIFTLRQRRWAKVHVGVSPEVKSADIRHDIMQNIRSRSGRVLDSDNSVNNQ
jgi:hypothetical protein